MRQTAIRTECLLLVRPWGADTPGTENNSHLANYSEWGSGPVRRRTHTARLRGWPSSGWIDCPQARKILTPGSRDRSQTPPSGGRPPPGGHYQRSGSRNRECLEEHRNFDRSPGEADGQSSTRTVGRHAPAASDGRELIRSGFPASPASTGAGTSTRTDHAFHNHTNHIVQCHCVNSSLSGFGRSFPGGRGRVFKIQFCRGESSQVENRWPAKLNFEDPTPAHKSST